MLVQGKSFPAKKKKDGLMLIREEGLDTGLIQTLVSQPHGFSIGLMKNGR